MIVIIAIISSLPLFAYESNISLNTPYDGVTNNISTSPFIQFLSTNADGILIKLKDALTPGIFRLTRSGTGSSDIESIAPISSSSFIGILISALLTLECVVLGIKSFMDEGVSLINLIKHLLIIALLLAFIALLPLISEGLLNIFITAGVVAGGGAEWGEETYFPFMPSSIINMLGTCKGILDILRTNIGGISLSSLSRLPEVFLIMISNLLIAVPYLIMSVMVIFWYFEFSIIVLVATVALPFSVFSYTAITNIKSIIKALLLQGMKIFLGVFASTLCSNVISSSLTHLEYSTENVTNVVIYIILMTVVFVFSLTKAPGIMLSALGGSVSTAASSFRGIIRGRHSSGSSGKTQKVKNKGSSKGKSASGSNESKGESIDSPRLDASPQNVTPPIPQEPPASPPEGTHPQPEVPVTAPQKTESVKALPIKPPETKEKMYITSHATAKRQSDTYKEFEAEGHKNVSIEKVKERARWEATYEKLEKLKKKGFVDNNGNKIKAAEDQYNAMRKAKKDYLNGLCTWDGEKL